MANTILTMGVIAKAGLAILENELTTTKFVNREYDATFKQSMNGYLPGQTINVRKPARYIGRNGANQSVEGFQETSVPITLNQQPGVDMTFSSIDLTLNIADFSERVLKPAISNIANQIDYGVNSLSNTVPNVVGVPGQTPNQLLTFLQGKALLDNKLASKADRSAILDPYAEAYMVDSLKGLFNPTSDVAEQYKRGTMGMAGGFKFSMDQNVQRATIGAGAGTTGTVTGGSQFGSSIITGGWTASTLIFNVGDIVTFAGVQSVNYQSRQAQGVLQQFVITAPVTSSAGGAATLPIYPPLNPANSGTQSVVQQATVNTSPAGGASVYVWGAASAAGTPIAGATAGVSTTQNLLFQKDAFTLACADLPLPGGVDMAARASDDQLGLSLRIIRQYTIGTDQWITRLDVLCGWAALRPELAVRVCG